MGCTGSKGQADRSSQKKYAAEAALVIGADIATATVENLPILGKVLDTLRTVHLRAEARREIGAVVNELDETITQLAGYMAQHSADSEVHESLRKICEVVEQSLHKGWKERAEEALTPEEALERLREAHRL
eukprot:4146583-Amphidinium_carterae.1